MYQRCPTCKSKGLFKKEVCPTCLGERVIHKESGLPPSKYVIPFTYTPIYPFIPSSPSIPQFPWSNPFIGGTDQQQILSTITTRVQPTIFTNLTN